MSIQETTGDTTGFRAKATKKKDNNDDTIALNTAIAAETETQHPNPDIVPLPTKAYKGDLAPPGAYPHLKDLISKVHNHLVLSVLTRHAYIKVFRAVYEHLCSKGRQTVNHRVATDEDVSKALAGNWPTYNLYWIQEDKPRQEDLRWAMGAQKRLDGEVSDTLYLLGNLVNLAEDAASNPNEAKIPAQKLQMIIAANVFRRLLYVLLCIFFGPKATLPRSINGKEYCLDWILMHGRVMVQWDDQNDFPRMAGISRVVFVAPDNDYTPLIRNSDASAFIDSLSTDELQRPGDNALFWNYGESNCIIGSRKGGANRRHEILF